MEDFSEIMKELITEKGLSLRKLHSLTGVSSTQYSRYLRGDFPTLKTAIKICDYFDCSLDYLFGISEIKKEKQNYDNINLSKFLPRYKALLKENNITHWKFCKAYNLSESTIRHWGYGEVPKIQSLIIIAYNLSSSIDYLVGRY